MKPSRARNDSERGLYGAPVELNEFSIARIKGVSVRPVF